MIAESSSNTVRYSSWAGCAALASIAAASEYHQWRDRVSKDQDNMRADKVGLDDMMHSFMHPDCRVFTFAH